MQNTTRTKAEEQGEKSARERQEMLAREVCSHCLSSIFLRVTAGSGLPQDNDVT
jgi:hypothetical protein